MRLDEQVRKDFKKHSTASNKLMEYMIINNVTLYPMGKGLYISYDDLLPEQSTLLRLGKKTIEELDLYELKWHPYRLKMPTDWRVLTSKYHTNKRV